MTVRSSPALLAEKHAFSVRHEVLSAKDKAIHSAGLVSVPKSPHDELDRAMLDAYGWSDLVGPAVVGPASAGQSAQGGMNPAPQETILQRLVALGRARRVGKGYTG
jgi:hypothetical protein